jgi:hypothetical protein
VQNIIPNAHVSFVNNVILNPDGEASQWRHFAIDGPAYPTANTNVPSPSRADHALRIAGNIIWNVDNANGDMPLGVGDESSGCEDDNPTCNAAQLVADNVINIVMPELLGPEAGLFAPAVGGNVYMASTVSQPRMDWSDAPNAPPVPPPPGTPPSGQRR